MRLNVESRTSFSGRGAAGLKFWGDSRLPTPLHAENLFAKILLTGRDGFPMLAPPVGVLMVSESEDWRFTS